MGRMFLQSLVTTADKNNDNMMDFDEFEGFSDFGFVLALLDWNRGIGEIATRLLRSFTVCDRAVESCFPSDAANMRMMLRFSNFNPDIYLLCDMHI